MASWTWLVFTKSEFTTSHKYLKAILSRVYSQVRATYFGNKIYGCQNLINYTLGDISLLERIVGTGGLHFESKCSSPNLNRPCVYFFRPRIKYFPGQRQNKFVFCWLSATKISQSCFLIPQKFTD